MLILGYFGHFPLYTQIPWFWHFLESGILTFPGWCYISSEYMIYRKCLYTVYLYCLKSLHICYIILFYFIVFYYPEISHILHYRVILLCICCLLVGSAVFSFLFIIVFTCRVVITGSFGWWWSGIACCRSLQLPFCGWSGMVGPACRSPSVVWVPVAGPSVSWGLVVCWWSACLGCGDVVGLGGHPCCDGWVSLSIKEKGCPFTRTAIRLVFWWLLKILIYITIEFAINDEIKVDIFICV